MDFLQYDSITIFQKNPQPNPAVTGGEPSLLCTPTLNFKQLIKKTQNSFSSTQDHRDGCFFKGLLCRDVNEVALDTQLKTVWLQLLLCQQSTTTTKI